MPSSKSIDIKEKIIKDLAMSITHSEQGFYEKNEDFVKLQLSQYAQEVRKEVLEEVEKKFISDTMLLLDKQKAEILENIERQFPKELSDLIDRETVITIINSMK